MGKSVWLVEKGSYSDYYVVGVFSTEAKAQLMADACNKADSYEEASIVERPLDLNIRDLTHGRTPFVVRMAENGDVLYVGSGGMGDEASAKWYMDGLWVQVWAKDETHAVKIANEKRIQILAANG